jgi:phosphatidylglycerol---prolipoprotein diacylglyceryl transferase
MSEFLTWWQHLPEKMNPVFFKIGAFSLHYYGLMYLVAFAVVYAMATYRVKREKEFRISVDQIQDLMIFMMIGVIVGGRLGYVVIYNPAYYLRHPLEIVLPFNFSNGFTFTGISGMSFHGGLIGVLVAIWYFTRKTGSDFWDVADLFAPIIPLGYTFGRLGNFINGELYGRVTTSSIGMYFPAAPDPDLRYPSQLFEAFFEGIVLFIVLWNLRKIRKPKGAMLAFYLIGYGLFRFFIEYFRQPDPQFIRPGDPLGFVFLSFSMGQILCSLMIAGGVLLYLFLSRLEKRRAGHS